MVVRFRTSPISASPSSPVRAVNASPEMIPRPPPMIAPSSMNEASRSAPAKARNGPRRARFTMPTSPPSICQPLPSVAASPMLSRDCAASGVDITALTRNIPTMDRRTFVLLTGVASGSSLVMRRRGAAVSGIKPSGDGGRLQFEFDDQHRWSLWYRGNGPAVPLVDRATLALVLLDRVVALGELEDIAAGERRAPAGDATVIRGRTGGLFLEAEFLSEAPGEGLPRAAITVTLFPDAGLPVVGGVRYARAPGAQWLAGDGTLLALTNGPHSWSECTVAPVGDGPAPLVSFATGALVRRGPTADRALAWLFEAGEPGTGSATLAVPAIEVKTDWTPARAIRTAGDGGTLRIAFDPGGDPLAALRAAAA